MIITKNPNYKTVSFEDENGVMVRFDLYKRRHAKKEIKRKKRLLLGVYMPRNGDGLIMKNYGKYYIHRSY